MILTGTPLKIKDPLPQANKRRHSETRNCDDQGQFGCPFHAPPNKKKSSFWFPFKTTKKNWYTGIPQGRDRRILENPKKLAHRQPHWGSRLHTLAPAGVTRVHGASNFESWHMVVVCEPNLSNKKKLPMLHPAPGSILWMDERNPFRTTLKPWEAIAWWYLHDNHYSGVA